MDIHTYIIAMSNLARMKICFCRFAGLKFEVRERLFEIRECLFLIFKKPFPDLKWPPITHANFVHGIRRNRKISKNMRTSIK